VHLAASWALERHFDVGKGLKYNCVRIQSGEYGLTRDGATDQNLCHFETIPQRSNLFQISTTAKATHEDERRDLFRVWRWPFAASNYGRNPVKKASIAARLRQHPRDFTAPNWSPTG
jgi:hypothetical protein